MTRQPQTDTTITMPTTIAHTRNIRMKIEDLEREKWILSNDKGFEEEKSKLQEINQELYHYKTQNANLLNQIKNAQIELSNQQQEIQKIDSRRQEVSKKLQQILTEYDTSKKDKKEFVQILANFEQQLSELQSYIKVITEDRDDIRLLYEQVNSELQLIRRGEDMEGFIGIMDAKKWNHWNPNSNDTRKRKTNGKFNQ